MQIVSWNVQNGIDAFAEPKLAQQCDYLIKLNADVIALQEVDSEYMASLEEALDDYHWHFAPALSFYKAGQFVQFGNAIGAKKGTAVQWRAHYLLPAASDAKQHMPRSAGELVVEIAGEFVRVVTSHLEFYCAKQRRYQLQQIDGIVNAASISRDYPSQATEGLYKPLPLPVNAIICGDFNFADQSDEYQSLFISQGGWRDLAQSNPRPTCGIFDTKQWPNGADRRDYFATNSQTLQAKVVVDEGISLSDHQPCVLHVTHF
ncbi:endonuclease/exonuclease/phosphatase family protein [Vibrio neonatus]|uniref:endonuclease/exonuclease/phosphatase family protein n=1 Tax=Vibrio neonatus TaxID=278860 RepID=UPI0021C265DE|nr:endonuclease/exonuclease/phosphatase family protein [Vibrio neonatus]